MTDVYIFQAALWCGGCIRELMLDNAMVEADFDHSDHDPVHALESMMRAHSFATESDYDSDKFPKGPTGDGGGEADTPQHCDGCRGFLENPLTGDGYKYVLEKLRNNEGNADVLQEWRDFYGDDHMPDSDPRVSINDILSGDEDGDPAGVSIRYHTEGDSVLAMAAESDLSDGWYWWRNDGPNTAFGPFPSRDDALEDAEAEQNEGPEPWLMAGDWFEDAEGFLYIVPQPTVIAECHGPDNDTMDKINSLCRDHNWLTDDDVESLGLTRIAEILKRYDAGGLGYHHA